MASRRNETQGVYFRSNRLFAVNHDWYFATREGENKGPFKDRNQAELALAAFIARCISEGDSHSVATRNGDGNEVLNDMVEEARDLMQIIQSHGITRACVWAYDRIRSLRGAGHKTRHPLRRIAVIEHLLNSH
jgi:hypothetical protein